LAYRAGQEEARPSQCTTWAGTFDISILEVGEGVVEVKATNGDTHLVATTLTSA